MAVDYAEKEREFLESLAQDTGRDLAEWMAAIGETRLTDRNAIIDWLRQQGFLFARASWLERIHHNGGRPIYIDASTLGGHAPVALKSAPPLAAPPRPPAQVSIKAPLAVVPAPVSHPPAPAPLPVPFDGVAVPVGAALDGVLAEAKGYRPLALLVLKEIERAAPEASFAPGEGYIAIQSANGGLAGILTVAAKELRLALALGARGVLPPFSKPKFTKTHAVVPGEFTHMVILTDARQMTPELLAAVTEAVARG